jgi:hypothetical protein
MRGPAPTRLLAALTLAWLTVSVALVSATPVAAASAAERAGDGYSAYVACSHRTSAQASHECKASDRKAAFFLSSRHAVTYKVCVKFPGRKQRLCANAQGAPKGQKQRVTISSDRTGRHKVWWYVDGKVVASWRFDVVPG